MAIPRFQVVAAMAAVLTHAAVAADYTYVAVTEGTVRKEGMVQVGTLTWLCYGKRCTIHGSLDERDVATCQALAREVGPIESFGRPGWALGPAGLACCNQPDPGAVAPGDSSSR
ncbi:MAG: hypothetical protein EPO25_09315 [Gammaproteobacteria bacterium]|nr:MAG: hypothetical protein EPO25_09315 [Gammaproteobacteria bacterium]